MVDADDVINIYQSLSANNIQIWLTGGWGIDALLREQTRPHKDLDVIMLLDDVVHLRELLGRAGYALKEIWSENRWTVDAQGNEIPTAFVLQDTEGREAMRACVLMIAALGFRPGPTTRGLSSRRRILPERV
jgi:lincosamide nucleotidyltransferase A/C/D/E